MDIEWDVFPFLRDNDLMIERDPPDQSQDQYQQPSPPPRSDYWMIDSNQIFPPAWLEQFPEIHPLGHGEDFPRHGQPELATVELLENENGNGYRLPSEDELSTQWLEKQAEEYGIEALAWYRPYHLDQGRWGITITDRGIWYIAQYLVKEIYSEPYTGEQIQECFDIATEFLYHHEMFHFKVEFAATVMELNAANPTKVYARYWDDRSGGLWFGSPSTSLGGEAPLEEAMANEYARQKICRAWGQRIRPAIEKFMATQQPSGYRDFHLVPARDDWKDGLEELSNMLLEHATPFGKDSFHIDRHFLNADEVVPCQILVTELPSNLQVRASNILNFCRVKKIENEMRKLKKKFLSVVKDFEKSLDEIAQNNGQVPPGANNKREPHFATNIGRNRKVEIYYVRGDQRHQSYRVYREEIGGAYVFRRLTAKKKQDATIDAIKKNKITSSDAIHKPDCSAHF